MLGARSGLVRWGMLAGAVVALCVACSSTSSPAKQPVPSSVPAPATSSASSASPQPQIATPRPGRSMPAQCRQWGCRPQQTVQLPGGRFVTVWHGVNEENYASRPVRELAGSDGPLQWWVSPRGDGWGGTLTCLTSGLEPNCVLTDMAGMHAGLAELVIVRGDRLVHPAGGEVTTNSGGVRAVDLDRDGYLDVVGVVNDYQPNFAQGHSYWQTFRYAHDRYTATGCAPKTATPPTTLLTGACPAIGTR